MVDNLETMDLSRIGPQEGPTFSYTLTYEQIMRCLREAFNRTNKKGKLIQTWVLGFLSVVYLAGALSPAQEDRPGNEPGKRAVSGDALFARRNHSV